MPRVTLRNKLDVDASAYVATLWVNASTGDDSRSKATVAGSAGSLPWATIGRAAWGSTNRAAPDTAQAASAGDVVSVAGGTYSYAGTVSSRQEPVYNCTNAGTVGSPLTFVAAGVVILTGPSANAPAIGAFQRNYIRWRRETGGSWQITCDSRGTPDGGTDGTSANSAHWNTRPDTGPVVCWDCTGTWVEGLSLDGGLQADYADNYNGVRVENATSFVIRYCTIASFRHSSYDNHNGSCVTLYGALNGLIERNDFSNAGAGVYFKDTGVTNPQNGNVVRYNRVHNLSEAFAWSVTAEGENNIYQNLVLDCNFGIAVTGGGPQPDRVFNNTFVNMANAGLYLNTPTGAGGLLAYNNIWSNCAAMIYVDGTMPAATQVSAQHNVYQTFTNFYTGTDGNRTFAGFKTAYTDQDVTAVASVNSDPLFTNAAGGDYTLQAGSPARNLGTDIGDLDGDSSVVDTCHAGAYQTGAETMGV